MTKVTELKMYRKYEGRGKNGKLIPRKVPLEFPRSVYKLECGSQTFEVLLSSGQGINTKKMCKKLLKESFNQNNEQENKRKKGLTKGYSGQNHY